MNFRLPYVPGDYECIEHGDVGCHFSTQETDASREFVQKMCTEALQYVIEVLNYAPVRDVHVCCYHSSDEAGVALERNVSPTMAMAPFSNAECGLVIIHSPELDPMNAVESRMRRVLAHEFVHLLVAERSESTKLLGDGNRNMRVSAWLNEGLAEVIGLKSIAAEAWRSAMLEGFCASQQFYEFGTLSQWLDDLDDVSRALAFEHATAAVELLRQYHGIRPVFDQLLRIEAFFSPQEACSPSRLPDLAVTPG